MRNPMFRTDKGGKELFPPGSVPTLIFLVYAALSVYPLYPLEYAHEESGQAQSNLSEAFESAFSNSEAVAYRQSLVQILSSKLSPLVQERIPSVTLHYLGSEEYTRGEVFKPLHTFSFGLRFEVFDGGRGLLREKAAQTAVEAASVELRKVKNALRTKLIESIVSVALAEKELGVYETSFLSASKRIRETEVRMREGYITEETFKRGILEVQKIGLLVRKAEIELDGRKNSLEELIGKKGWSFSGTIPSAYSSFLLESPLTVEKCSETAIKTSIRVKEASLQIRYAEIEQKKSRRKHLPSMDLYSDIRFRGEDFPPATPEIRIGVEIRAGSGGTELSYAGSTTSRRYGESGRDEVSVQIPLLTDSKEKKLAALELQKRKTQKRSLSKGVEREVRKKYEQLRLLEQEKKLTEKVLQLERRRHKRSSMLYEKGEIRSAALFEDLLRRTEAEIELYRVISSLFLAEYRLLSFCGMLDEAKKLTFEFFRSKETQGTQRGTKP